MEATKSESRSLPFVLTPPECTKIFKLLSQEHSSIQLTCRHDIERKYKTLGEFLDFENSSDKSIKELLLHSYSLGSENSTSLKLRNAPTSTIVVCKGDEEYVTTITSKLEDRFSAIKPWYGWLAKSEWIITAVLLWIPYLFLTSRGPQSSYSLSHLKSDISQFPLNQLGFVLLGIILFILVPLAIWRLTRQLWSYIFPMGVFAFGQGAMRHKNRDLARTLVGIGFVVNVVAGLVVLLMS